MGPVLAFMIAEHTVTLLTVIANLALLVVAHRRLK